nr:splicing factor U2af small subunit B-like [Tanacetum cinerariifolium]
FTPPSSSSTNTHQTKTLAHRSEYYHTIVPELSHTHLATALDVVHLPADMRNRSKPGTEFVRKAYDMRDNLAGRVIGVDFSPVTDFQEATCRRYEENTCNRGGYCSFVHLKKFRTQPVKKRAKRSAEMQEAEKTDDTQKDEGPEKIIAEDSQKQEEKDENAPAETEENPEKDDAPTNENFFAML